MAALLAADVAGGLLAVSSGVNTWGEAWGSQALLAAPLPMIGAQVVLTTLAVRLPGRRAAVPAGLLAAACLVSVVSGFFDGGLGNEKLTPALSAYQVFLLGLTGVVGRAGRPARGEGCPEALTRVRQLPGLRPASGVASSLVAASSGFSLNRSKEARTSSSASVRPTQLAPSTDLPGSRSL